MKKQRVRERVLRIAREKFLKHGFHKISMDRLVQELHTSKSSLYNHFRSKDELVLAVIDELNAEINQKLGSVLNDDKLTFKGKLIAISEFTSQLLSQVSEEFLRDLELHTPEIWDHYQQARKQRIDRYYRQLFEAGIREGMVRSDLDPDLILITYLSLTEIPLLSGYVDSLNMNNQDIYDHITEIFLKGILIS